MQHLPIQISANCCRAKLLSVIHKIVKCLHQKEPVKQSVNATHTSQDSAENDPTKSTAESEQTTADPSTEQLLMMAAQFSSAQPASPLQETSTTSATTMMPAPITEPTINPSMAAMAPPLDATKPTVDKNAVKADNTSASDTSSFDATLEQALNKKFRLKPLQEVITLSK